MPAKNDNITKDPAAAGRKSKRGKARITQLRDAIGLERADQILKNIERNIDEFVNSPDKKLRFEATKAFTDYYKPKKSVSEVKFKGTVVFNVNEKLTNPE